MKRIFTFPAASPSVARAAISFGTALFLASVSPRANAAPSGPAVDRFLTATRQLTFEGRRSGEGYFSADGNRLIFQSEREPGNPFYQIYVLDLETGDVERVSPGHGKTTCAWLHPEGQRALFASTHDDPEARAKQTAELDLRASGKERRYAWDYDAAFELYVKDLRSGAVLNLSQARGYDAEGSFSPDGTSIAFASNRHAYSDTLSAEDQKHFEVDHSYLMDIYLMDADGSNVRRLTTTRGYDGGPFFSPDGSRICWRRFSADGATAEIYTMRVDGTDQKRITQLGAMSWAPYFHPSGEYLIFTTNRHGFANFELYLVDAAGEKEPIRVTRTDGFDGLPVFTPDGTGLYWTTNRTPEKQSQIFAARWDHDAARGALAAAPPATAGTPPSAHVHGHGHEVSSPTTVVTQPPIRVDDLRQHVERLASEAMEGRLAGTPGELMATEYVATWFEKYGLEPVGDDDTFFQVFPFTAGIALGEGNQLTLHLKDGARSFAVDESWRPLAYSATGSFEKAGVVFAGYGIVAPDAEEYEEYDSYVHLDVADKWVIVFRYMPEGIPAEQRQHFVRFSSLRYKAMVARDKGARGLLVVSGPNSKVKHPLVRLSFDASLAGTSIPAVSITDELATSLLEADGSGRTVKELQDKLDGGQLSMGMELTDVTLSARIELKKVKRTGRNVLGRLAAKDPDARERPAIIVGAHVDHLGRGNSGSLARDDERGEIHYGADDNASGVAAILEIAEFLKSRLEEGRLQLHRDIVFAAWSGEELGLLGSQYFVSKLEKTAGDPEHIRDQIAAALNLDMVGRLEQSLVLHGVGSSSVWRREIERRNAPVGLPLKLSADSYLPTDATSFYLKGVPILSAFTGSHEDYHTPRDVPEKLDYEDMVRICRFMALIARGLATSSEPPDYLEQERPKQQARAGLRAYLGTIPEYGETSVKGVVLSGVAGGGPAANAGVRGGDVIVELAGRKVENIYDYTYAIEALKIGQETKIVVTRAEKRVELKITPGSRE